MNQHTLNYLAFLMDVTRPQEGYLTLTAMHPNRPGTYSRHIALAPLDKPKLTAAIRDLEKANHAGWGAFVGIALRKQDLGRYQRGGYKDILDNYLICIDIDQPPAIALRSLDLLPTPTIIVDSGAGIHATYALTKPVNVQKANLLIQNLTTLAHGDHAINATTSLRLPGSINTKPDRGNIVTILSQTNKRYDPDRLPAPLPQPLRTPPDLCNTNRAINPELIRVVLAVLYRDYQACPKRPGSHWHAALCPFGHKHEKGPGDHFWFDDLNGAANCFGRHGGITLMQLCNQLGIRANDFGGLYKHA